MVQSSRPPYVASVSGDELISIALPPRSLMLDMNASNSIRSETDDFKPARYSFPDAHVPRSVLHRLGDIYKYDRRRDVPIVSSGGDWVIAEYFKADSHIPVSRFELLGRKVLRQEQLDAAGRTIRIVAIGWASASANEDERTTDISALGPHPAWMRVFEVSPAGKKRLVALAWRKAPFAAAPDANDEPGDDELVFGLPDGTAKWRSKVAFLRAWHIDAEAKTLSGKPRR